MQETVTQDRDKYIGGSDIPAIMDISPFVSRRELLNYKLGNEENGFKGNEYTEYGNIMEPKIRDFINSMGHNFVEDKKTLDDSDVLPLRCHVDGVDSEDEIILEIKTTSQIHDKACEYKIYLVQLLTYMHAYRYKEGILAVYERPSDRSEELDPERLQVFSIGSEDYESLWYEVCCAISDFRRDYAYLLGNPWADEADLPSRYALVPVAQQLMGLETSIAQAKAIIDQYDQLKKELYRQMESHGIKSWIMPNGTKVTLVPRGEDTIVKKFDEKGFAKDHEKMYAEYMVDTVKKGKAGYVRVTPVAETK